MTCSGYQWEGLLSVRVRQPSVLAKPVVTRACWQQLVLAEKGLESVTGWCGDSSDTPACCQIV